MKKKFIFTTIILSIFLSFTGCGKTAQTAVVTDEKTVETEDNSVIFTDSLGRTVEVEKSERVATMLGSFTDIWMLAGGEVIAAAKDSWTSFDLNLSEDVINLGGHMDPDIELLLSTEPDFVIASANLDSHIELEETLVNAGITVAYFNVSTVDDYLNMLDICTKLTNRPDLYEEYGTKVLDKIHEVKIRIDDSHPTVLFLRASESGGVKVKGSNDSVGGEMLADLGCLNIADSDNSLLEEFSMEAIIAADPDYIFITTQGTDTEAALQVIQDTLENNPAWRALSAVKNGNYHMLDKNLYNAKPNARWGEAYEILADILYPQK